MEWIPNPWPGAVVNLNAGKRPMEGAVNHDRFRHAPWVDVACDLAVLPWRLHLPLPVDVIVARGVLSWLPDPLGAVNECWRHLMPGGRLEIVEAAYDRPEAFLAPRVFHDRFFDIFDRSTLRGRGVLLWDSIGRPLTPWRIVASGLDGDRVRIVMEAQRGD